MKIKRDGNGSKYIKWASGPLGSGLKRAWVQTREGEKDWAGTGRYLNVVRCNEDTGNPGGNATDFPVYCDLPDEQILWAFISMVNAITGRKETD